MNSHYPFAPPAGTFPKIFEPSAYNAETKIKILTDEQALEETIQGRLAGAYPLCSIYEMLHNTKPRLNDATDYFTSRYVDLHPIRNLYNISNTLGTHNSMSVTGDWSILKTIQSSLIRIN